MRVLSDCVADATSDAQWKPGLYSVSPYWGRNASLAPSGELAAEVLSAEVEGFDARHRTFVRSEGVIERELRAF